jgi:hypothetical protein
MQEKRSENSNLSHKKIKCSASDVAGRGHRFCQLLFLAYIYEKHISEQQIVVASVIES